MYKKKLTRVALSGMIVATMIPGAVTPLMANTTPVAEAEKTNAGEMFTVTFETVDERITVNTTGGEVTDYNVTFKGKIGEKIIAPNVTVKPGYVFKGWQNFDGKMIAAGEEFDPMGGYAFGDTKNGWNAAFVAVVEEAPVVATANANITVDPTKGAFGGADAAAEKLVYNHLEENDYTLSALPTVEAKEGFKFTGWTVVNRDTNEVVYTLDTEATSIVFAKEAANYEIAARFVEVLKEANVKFKTDLTKGNFEGCVGENATDTISYARIDENGYKVTVPFVEAKEGFKFTGYEITDKEGNFVGKTVATETEYVFDAVANDYTFTAQFEEDNKTVNLAFFLEADKGVFVDEKGNELEATVINKNGLTEDAQHIALPKVNAKKGYKFSGWKVEGKEVIELDDTAFELGISGLAHFPKGSNVGYINAQALFVEDAPVAPEVAEMNLEVVVDKAKGNFGGADAAAEKLVYNHLEENDYTLSALPTVEAKEGFKFTGWTVVNRDTNEVVYTLDTEATSIVFAKEAANYVVEATFEEVAPEVAEMNLEVVVDKAKGNFGGADAAAEKLVYNHLEENDYTLSALPTVEAKEGFKFTGWTVVNRDTNEVVYTLDTEATSIVFAKEAANYVVEATFEEVALDVEKPETKPEEKPETKPEEKPADKESQKTDGVGTSTSTFLGTALATLTASGTAILALLRKKNSK